MAVLSNDKRWLVTLFASNKVVVPVLQDIVKQGMDKLYAFLDNHLNGLVTPFSLQTLTYANVCHLAATPSPASSLKDLNFGNINNNSGVHGKNKKIYNYNVNSSVDLAKLYLPDTWQNSRHSTNLWIWVPLLDYWDATSIPYKYSFLPILRTIFSRWQMMSERMLGIGEVILKRATGPKSSLTSALTS